MFAAVGPSAFTLIDLLIFRHRIRKMTKNPSFGWVREIKCQACTQFSNGRAPDKIPNRASFLPPIPSRTESRTSSSRRSPLSSLRDPSSASVGPVPKWMISALVRGSRASRSSWDHRNRRRACPCWRRGLGLFLRR
jgi:hypothetical protein